MTIGKLIQNYLGISLGILTFSLNLALEFTSELDLEKIIDKSIDLASISFGFLLAVLALILQGSSNALDRIKDSGNFSKLVSLNKKAVLASGLLIIVALAYLGGWKPIMTRHYHVPCFEIYNKVVESVSIGILVYQLAVVFSFLDIFYFIIKQDR